jgi:hypothetical protein
MIMTRSTSKRKCSPQFEALERKQLLSAGFATSGVVSPPPMVAVQSQSLPQWHIRPCGTGKGIIIITS